ncbi:hypothetical protein [Clostridium beijerinckii]|uniref:hypothetical protein n=1 Tax=Clostridium beijerinckii TaxID=1520 RepID=UPI001360C787|nr:hypothetical protein [Clostridium beijerinckii]MZK52711.1 hypothetical protein [Clostridium beijerinckii]MZK60818.1 hypothetical protein [Clostridium beijerinckii]MZK71024.1 hypothetical protein [Clostridium beijerinckii]MZK76411.1 hypothetical protein [Clostridium beijerinckii]MZK86083.1 hypothetical protein [Clostridium beijerinckii]
MRKIIIRLITFVVFVTVFTSNLAYAQIPSVPQPYGPKISNLQNKEDIINSLNQIKVIRANLTVYNIKPDTPVDELKTLDTDVQRYIEQLRIIRTNLVNHADKYSNSISDVFFSEQIVIIATCYIVSLKHQQLLVRAIESNVPEASTLFYSTYMIPIYYYLTLGDEQIAYTQTYTVIS